MHDELLRRIIHTKIKIGMHILEELPNPIQQSAKQVLSILQEELSSYTEKGAEAHPDGNLKSILIE
ncbi:MULTISPECIES: DUF3926 domain-containing protein [Bacillus]|uniref:DUF3926 domain-containing protein n=1 Tax=Bacillus cereus TaxID=1396 RepID=A0A2A8IR58_BACCE|nr:MULTISPECIES: DUF3926 domain-containing protein [Bacillus]MDH4422824.1 DUF3926 domain-containing protein [Bacillus cereus]PER21671.1 DUF3926 domain-containing protein [Bacillus cereus]PFA58701.1 DUF3926 domain-containing protein [Bacillus sp. AFS015896]PGL80635.1 DUF3926 domain-containing protein [Bacillus sp. AFS054943]PGU04599.1 DUF3926 domain-containing protein [Bacillus cereus]